MENVVAGNIRYLMWGRGALNMNECVLEKIVDKIASTAARSPGERFGV